VADFLKRCLSSVEPPGLRTIVAGVNVHNFGCVKAYGTVSATIAVNLVDGIALRNFVRLTGVVCVSITSAVIEHFHDAVVVVSNL